MAAAAHWLRHVWSSAAAATARAGAGGERTCAHWVEAAPRKLVEGAVHPWRQLRVERRLMEELGNNKHAHAIRSVHWRRRERQSQSLGGSGSVGCDGSTDGNSGGGCSGRVCGGGIGGSGIGYCGSVDGGSTGGFSGSIGCGDSGGGMSSH